MTLEPEDDPMTTADSAAHAGPAPDTSAPQAGAIRCSNAERERAGAAVQEAAGAGRLTMEETEERLGKVYAARYRHELEAFTADLPAVTKPAGWGLVFAMAREQFADDLTALTSRDRGRRTVAVRTVVIALAVLMFLMTVAMVVLHGIVPDGPEYGGGFH
jgi:hypothetical protein